MYGKKTHTPNAGKTSHILPKDFIPISLYSFLMKSLERLLDPEFRSNLNVNIINTSQLAYVKGWSGGTALHEIVEYIEKNLEICKFTWRFFSMKRVLFNNVKHNDL